MGLYDDSRERREKELIEEGMDIAYNATRKLGKETTRKFISVCRKILKKGEISKAAIRNISDLFPVSQLDKRKVAKNLNL